ncbi:MAG: hypothetical protein CMF39_00050 [Legionellaceae bacterium]|nr:hypothetical protein [Legionellaceae bacterium]
MRADFYYIPDENHLHFACRIAQKAFENNHQVYIHVSSDAEADELNKLLWTFQQNSFVPHGLLGDYKDDPPPIEIGAGDKPEHHDDVLINLSLDMPHFAQGFKRVLEVIANNNNGNTQANHRKKRYQDAQFEIHEHDLRQ